MGLYYANMSAENMPPQASGSAFGGREEYNQTPLQHAENCKKITDIMDALLVVDPRLSNPGEILANFNEEGSYILRAYERTLIDPTPGNLPFTKKRVTLSYALDRKREIPWLPRERYEATISISRANTEAVQKRFIIEYLDSKRTGITSTLEQPNFIDPQDTDTIRRETTPYDQQELVCDLAELQQTLDAGNQELSVFRLNTVTE